MENSLEFYRPFRDEGFPFHLNCYFRRWKSRWINLIANGFGCKLAAVKLRLVMNNWFHKIVFWILRFWNFEFVFICHYRLCVWLTNSESHILSSWHYGVWVLRSVLYKLLFGSRSQVYVRQPEFLEIWSLWKKINKNSRTISLEKMNT